MNSKNDPDTCFYKPTQGPLTIFRSSVIHKPSLVSTFTIFLPQILFLRSSSCSASVLHRRQPNPFNCVCQTFGCPFKNAPNDLKCLKTRENQSHSGNIHTHTHTHIPTLPISLTVVSQGCEPWTHLYHRPMTTDQSWKPISRRRTFQTSTFSPNVQRTPGPSPHQSRIPQWWLSVIKYWTLPF